jgi:hypothetical protein
VRLQVVARPKTSLRSSFKELWLGRMNGLPGGETVYATY